MRSPFNSRSLRCLLAVLHKNWTLKKRAWKTTTCELVSPSLFLSILVLGYYLSNVRTFAPSIYSATQLEVGPLLDAARPLLQNADIRASAQCAAASFRGGPACNRSNVPDVDLGRIRSSLGGLLTGPLPVLPIDVYLSIGLAVQDGLSEDNLRSLNEYDRSLQLFGNILVPGTLHLCPDGVEVRRFLNRSYTLHPILHNISVKVHESEEIALDAVLNPTSPNERTWAVINFAQLTPLHVDYSIRLNYSTVPNTNQLTNFIARGLDTRYQRYVTSGFFTLQSLVDEYAFELAHTDGGAMRYTPPASYAVNTPMPTAAYSQVRSASAWRAGLALPFLLCD